MDLVESVGAPRPRHFCRLPCLRQVARSLLKFSRRSLRLTTRNVYCRLSRGSIKAKGPTVQIISWNSRLGRRAHPPFLVSAHQSAQVRRKQIRDAQRAYRSRQQSLLTSLKERNAQLEDVVAQLSQIMHSFHSTRADPTLPPSKLPEAVGILEEEITQQLKRAEASAPGRSHRHSTQFPRFQERMQRLLVQPASESEKTICPPPSISTQSNSPFWTSFLRTSHPLIPSVHRTPHNASLDIFPALTDSCDQPITYTTTGFTQRLFRACAESGYSYLTNEAVADQEMWHEFGLMLQSMPRAQVTSYFKRVLETEPCNPVEDFHFPFISLGGAGTHFPRAKRLSIGSSGLQNLLPFQTTNGIKEVHSDEEWFDIHDIEGFLLSQGISLKSDRSRLMKPLLLNTPSMPLEQPTLDQAIHTQSLSTVGQHESRTLIMSIDESFIVSGKHQSFNIKLAWLTSK